MVEILRKSDTTSFHVFGHLGIMMLGDRFAAVAIIDTKGAYNIEVIGDTQASCL